MLARPRMVLRSNGVLPDYVRCDRDNIEGWIYGGSNTRVIKFGRLTGGSQGITSAGAVISWQNRSKTVELSTAQPQGELRLFYNTNNRIPRRLRSAPYYGDRSVQRPLRGRRTFSR